MARHEDDRNAFATACQFVLKIKPAHLWQPDVGHEAAQRVGKPGVEKLLRGGENHELEAG